MNFCVDSFLWTKHWIHYFTPETKEQSKQWILLGEPALKKAKTVKSVGKMMATVFWDACGIIHIDYFPSKQMIHNQWRLLRSLIGSFQQHFKEKTFPFGEEESALPLRQCMDSQMPGTDGQIQRIPLQIASPSSIFVRFRSLRLFPVSKPEEMVWRKEIYHQRAIHRRNRGLF